MLVVRHGWLMIDCNSHEWLLSNHHGKGTLLDEGKYNQMTLLGMFTTGVEVGATPHMMS
jgi:hypothetical protein